MKHTTKTFQKVNRALVSFGDTFKQPNIFIIEIHDGNLGLFKGITTWVYIKLQNFKSL